MSFDQILGKVRSRTATVTLCLDGRIGSELDRARRELAAADEQSDSLADDGRSDLRNEIDKLEVRSAEASHTFTVVGLPWRQWRELCDAHPVEKDVPTLPLRRNVTVAASMVAPAVAACVEDVPDVDSAEQLVDLLVEGQVVQLFLTIAEVNGQIDRVPPT